MGGSCWQYLNEKTFGGAWDGRGEEEQGRGMRVVVWFGFLFFFFFFSNLNEEAFPETS